MITTTQWIQVSYLLLAPMALLLLNTLDFLVRGKGRRGRFLCMEQRTLKSYLRTHFLLVLGFALLAVSWLWKPAERPFHICMTSWFIWVNIHAMISRRKKKPTTGSTTISNSADAV